MRWVLLPFWPPFANSYWIKYLLTVQNLSGKEEKDIKDHIAKVQTCLRPTMKYKDRFICPNCVGILPLWWVVTLNLKCDETYMASHLPENRASWHHLTDCDLRRLIYSGSERWMHHMWAALGKDCCWPPSLVSPFPIPINILQSQSQRCSHLKLSPALPPKNSMFLWCSKAHVSFS